MISKTGGHGFKAVISAVCLILAFALLISCAGCANFTKKEWTADPDALAKAAETAGRNKLLIGCWIPPRPHQMKDDESAEARMKEVAESGINMVCTHHNDLPDMEFIHRLIKASAKCGVEVMIELGTDLSAEGIERNLEVVRETVGYENLYGYNLYDEPVDPYFPGLKEEYRLVKELVGDTKVVMMNLLPNYGPAGIMAPEPVTGMGFYRTYALNAILTGTDVLSFDYYPYNNGDNVPSFQNLLRNFCDLRAVADKFELPLWGFISNCGWTGMRVPETREILLDDHLHLLFGAKSYSYFLYAQHEDPGAPGGFTGMLDWYNNLTDTYERVRTVNGMLDNTGYRVLSYDLEGIIAENVRKEYESALSNAVKLHRDGFLSEFDSDGIDVLLGVFKARTAEENVNDGYATDTADKAYYVLNFDRWNTANVHLEFTGVREYTAWGSSGIEAMGAARELDLVIEAGDAKFVEFKTFAVDGN